MKNRIARVKWVAAIVGCVVSLAVAAPRGTAPLSSAAKYQAHAELDNATVGATLLTPEKVRRAFVSDVKRCCVVVEFAIYPKANQPVAVSLDNLAIRVVDADTTTKAATPAMIAATLQKGARSDRDVTVTQGTGVGYSSGPYYDPSRGVVQGRGITTSTGVGVGVGAPGTATGSSEADRNVMETELSEKCLPEGQTTSPVAGYIYFSIPSRPKKATYQLEYMLNNEKVVLPLPQ